MVEIKPLNLAELLSNVEAVKSQRAQREHQDYQMAKERRLSDLLSSVDLTKPEGAKAIMQVDPRMGMQLQDQQVQLQQHQQRVSSEDQKVFQNAAVGIAKQWDMLPAEQKTPEAWQSLVHNTRNALQQATGGRLGSDDKIDHITPEAVYGMASMAGYNPQAELAQKKQEWKAKADIEHETGAQPYYTPIYDQSGNLLSFNARNGQTSPVLNGGQPITGAKYANNLLKENEFNKKAGSVEGEASGKAAAKNAGYESSSSAKQILGVIGAAPGKIDDLIQASTGSGIGSAVDAAAGMIGSTTKGAAALAELKPLASKLTAMQPRFEGPQSDADRKYYQDMAGNLADPNTPVEQKLLALKAIRELSLKYALQDTGDQQQSAPAAETPAPGSPIKVNSVEEANQLPSGTLFITPTGKVKRKP